MRVTERGFVRLAWTSLIGLILIVPSGALVRLTGSGLGCPDVPTCNGELIPELTGHVAIEWSNRVFSALVVALCVLTWLGAWRLPGASRRLRAWAALPAIASLAQGPLGAVTVLSDLHPLAVSSHFLVSMLALGAGVVVVLVARERDDAPAVSDRARRRALGLALIALGGVIVTGVLVTAAGPHPGDPDVTIRWWNLADAAAVHVRVVIAFVVIGLAVGVWLWRRRTTVPLPTRLIATFAPLLALQIGLGEYQYRNQLPWGVILAHVTVAALVWTVACAIWWRASHLASPTSHRLS
jgi:heme a synthase